MMQSICGCSPEHLAYAEQKVCRWRHRDVYWSFVGMLDQFTLPRMKEAFSEAWSYWTQVCDLNAIYTERPNSLPYGSQVVLVDVGRIDGASGTLAWSELPCGQTTRLNQKYDNDERWVVSPNPGRGEIDLVRVAAHEIGHVIGISHLGQGSPNLMAPMYSATIRKPQPGDIAEAVKRYGRPKVKPKPTPAPPKPPPPEPEPEKPDMGLLDIIKLLSRLGPLIELFVKLLDDPEVKAFIDALVAIFAGKEKITVRELLAAMAEQGEKLKAA